MVPQEMARQQLLLRQLLLLEGILLQLLLLQQQQPAADEQAINMAIARQLCACFTSTNPRVLQDVHVQKSAAQQLVAKI